MKKSAFAVRFLLSSKPCQPQQILLAFCSAVLFAGSAQAQVAAAPVSAAKAAAAPAGLPASGAACSPLMHQRFNRLQDEAPQDLCQYAGKVTLVVNTASYCGFTQQYQGLEALYAKYQAKGLVVLGFPSNDFGKQEPGSSKEIADFCYNTYGVKFPMFSKSSVTGPQANPLFVSLIRETGKAPEWNFHKYLIDRHGRVVRSYASQVEPVDRGLVADIEKALAQPL
jgi:glutathione peroxidase